MKMKMIINPIRDGNGSDSRSIGEEIYVLNELLAQNTRISRLTMWTTGTKVTPEK